MAEDDARTLAETLVGQLPALELARYDAAGASDMACGRRAATGAFPEPLQLTVAAALRGALAGRHSADEVADGEGGRARVAASPTPAGGALLSILDVTAAVDAYHRADALDALLHVVFEHVPVAMTLLRDDLRPIRTNAALSELTGHSRERHADGRVLECFDDSEIGPLFARIAAIARGDAPGAVLHHTLIRADGRRLAVRAEVVPVPLPDGGTGALLVTTDRTADRELEEELASLTNRDPLTGLLNREGLEAALQAAADRRDGPSVLLVADLDDFSALNDQLGPTEADLLLTDAADALRGTVRGGDAVARIGGDEFAILLPGQDLEAGERVAEAIISRFGARIAERGGAAAEAGLGLSLGVAAVPPGTPPSRAIAAAGVGVHAAKSAGKGRWAHGL